MMNYNTDVHSVVWREENRIQHEIEKMREKLGMEPLDKKELNFATKIVQLAAELGANAFTQAVMP